MTFVSNKSSNENKESVGAQQSRRSPDEISNGSPDFLQLYQLGISNHQSNRYANGLHSDSVSAGD